MSRIAAVLAAILCLLTLPAVAEETLEVWKSPTCSCCIDWVRHMQESGYAVAVHDTPQSSLDRIKAKASITSGLASCHTAKIGGYVIEGHVPAGDVARLLREKPDAIGLTVPGMPIGAPGMEMPDGRTEPYDVLLIRRDGGTEVFARRG